MIITPEDQEKILETFREYPDGLSVTELARKSGINRNKASVIAETLHKKGLLSLYQQSSAKIYAVKEQSPIHHLIGIIPEPAFVINESFHVIGINKAYAEMYKVDPRSVSGMPGEQLIKPPYRILADALKRELEEGTDGKPATFPDESGTPLCTTFRISQSGSRPSLIVSLHPDRKTREKIETLDRIRRIVDRFSAGIPGIMAEKTWEEVLSRVARNIQTDLPGTLVFTLIVDEQKKTTTISSFYAPDGNQDLIAKPGEIQLKDLRIALTDLKIIQYRTCQPICYYTDSLETLLDPPLQAKIISWCKDLGLSSISLIGITAQGILTGILGMGSLRDTVSQTIYEDLLSSLSGYLNLISSVYHLKKENREISIEYQQHYQEIYNLLTEKTEENILRTTETEYTRSILGAVLHTMGISLIVTTTDGTLISANQTAMETCQITEETLLSHPPVLSSLPPDIAETIARLTNENQPGNGTKDTLTTGEQTIHWYLIRPEPVESCRSCLFIGEKSPAPLNRYLRSLRRDGVFMPGTGLFL